MTNCLLIHNDNLPLDVIEAFGDKMKFDIPQSKMLEYDYSFDKEAHLQLYNALDEQNYDAIFISYYLSEQNYLELTGLRLAAHIRLTVEFNHQYVPLILIGNERPDQIAKLSNLGNILFTSGVFSTPRQDKNSIEKQFEWILNNKPQITKTEFIRCIERLQISPPSNYQSHHSIDNELALVRWSEYLKCDDDIPEIKKNLQTGLYFKYHRTLNPVKSPAKGKPYPISGKGKVLLIDDEAEKGWKSFYECFFQVDISNKSIEFEALQVDFKSLSQQEIIEAARDRVEKFNADLVLLDLRLCDLDFNINTEPKKLSGYKILEEIKKINKGIQVIIITASNKVWNYQSTHHDLGANGYIIKRGDTDPNSDLQNLKTAIEDALDKSAFLKKIDHKFEIIKPLFRNDRLLNSTDDRVREKIDANLDIAFILLEKAFKIPKYFNYAYLQIFLILEEYLTLEEVCIDKTDEVYIICGEREYLILNGNQCAMSWLNGHYKKQIGKYKRRVDTNFKVSALLLFRHNCDTSGEKKWTTINKLRNKAAHEDGYIVTKKEIKQLFDFVTYIFNSENIDPCDEDLALTKPSWDDKLRQLQERYNV